MSPDFTADHRGRHRFRHQENALQVGVQHPIPVFFGLFVRWPKQADTRVVHQDGNRSERCFGPRHEVIDAVLAGYVGHGAEDFDPEVLQLRDSALKGVRIPSADGDRGAQACEPEGDRTPDSAAAAGDQRDSSGQGF